MESTTSFRFSSLLFFFIVAFIAVCSVNAAANDQCQYTIKVKTANVKDAGTDSTINLIMGDANGKTVKIQNLANWGVNGPSYDYFEQGNLDIFSGKAACIAVCSMIVSSDNSGDKSGWKLDYIEISSIGSQKYDSMFEFNQWLALDEPPHSLSALHDRWAKKYYKQEEQEVHWNRSAS